MSDRNILSALAHFIASCSKYFYKPRYRHSGSCRALEKSEKYSATPRVSLNPASLVLYDSQRIYITVHKRAAALYFLIRESCICKRYSSRVLQGTCRVSAWPVREASGSTACDHTNLNHKWTIVRQWVGWGYSVRSQWEGGRTCC
jgi:hypothetical protein